MRLPHFTDLIIWATPIGRVQGAVAAVRWPMPLFPWFSKPLDKVF